MESTSDSENAKLNRRPLLEKRRKFVLEIVIDDVPYRTVPQALNLDSLSALLSIATMANMPRIKGWTVFDEDGEPLLSVNAIDFLAEIAKATPLGKDTGDKGVAGWRALPIVTPTSEEFQNAMQAAKKGGKIPQ